MKPFKLYALTMDDGSLTKLEIIGELVKGLPVFPLPSEVIGKWAPVKQAKVISIKEIQQVDLPVNKDFRKSWKLDGDRIVVDMGKAKSEWLDTIRQSRNAKLADLDKDWMKAMGGKDQTEADRVEVERQTLRDIPQTFDLTSATTPEQLKALWPTGLAGPKSS